MKTIIHKDVSSIQIVYHIMGKHGHAFAVVCTELIEDNDVLYLKSLSSKSRT